MDYISPYNPTLIKRLVWGNESYTSNSDAVCILKHSGLIDFNNIPDKKYVGLSLHCQVGRCNSNISLEILIQKLEEITLLSSKMAIRVEKQTDIWALV
jgi:hypothetical protein